MPGVRAHGRMHTLTRSAVVPMASRQSLPSTQEQEACLRSWLVERGGFIHPSLQIVDQAPCGCRGVVSRERISLEQLEHQPLVVIPRSLQLGDEYASATLQAQLGSGWQDGGEHLSSQQILAVVVAAERVQGAASSWHPYISTLCVHGHLCTHACAQSQGFPLERREGRRGSILGFYP